MFFQIFGGLIYDLHPLANDKLLFYLSKVGPNLRSEALRGRFPKFELRPRLATIL